MAVQKITQDTQYPGKDAGTAGSGKWWSGTDIGGVGGGNEFAYLNANNEAIAGGTYVRPGGGGAGVPIGSGSGSDAAIPMMTQAPAATTPAAYGVVQGGGAWGGIGSKLGSLTAKQWAQIASGALTLRQALSGSGGGQVGTMDTGAAGETAMSTLMEILQSGGQTDPRLMNQQITSIDRGTQGAQMTARGNLAAGGLQGSRLGEALQAAIGQAGEERQAGLQADEAQRMEQRKRDDLKLFYDTYVKSMLDQYAIRTGQAGRNQDRNTQEDMAKLSAFVTLFAELWGE